MGNRMAEFDPESFRTDTNALKLYNQQVLEEFRANSGKVGGIFENFDIVLLTTTGIKSGMPRLTPLVCLNVDRRMVVLGSRGGAPKDPAWVGNARANPRATLEIGTQCYEICLRELHGAERHAVFAEVVAAAPNFGTYQSLTDRVIPIFEMRRTDAESPLRQRNSSP